jgi:hypothetical protein
MIMTITATTDRQYLGIVFDSEDNPIILDDDVSVIVDRTIPIDGGIRFINSNYIIDAKGD